MKTAKHKSMHKPSLLFLAVAMFAVSACQSEEPSPPDLLLAGDQLLVRGMALGSEPTVLAESQGIVGGCVEDERLAEIIGPVDYCELENPIFLGVATSSAAVHFDGGSFSALHIKAQSSAFPMYAQLIAATLGPPDAPKALANGEIPKGEANMSTADGQPAKSDYRMWDTPSVYVEMYEIDKGELRLMIRRPLEG